MEPVTQALLGAATAELVAGRKLRGRALGWGAAIGMSPDLDVLLGGLHNGYGEWLYHRGTTHSLWFGFVMGPVLGWILWRWRDFGNTDTLPAWIRVGIVALVTHPLLDGFTPYGTQFFAPFVRDRFAWNGVAIVDPIYTMMLGMGVACAVYGRWPEARRRRGLATGLTLSTLYLLAGLGINRWVEQDLRAALGPEIERRNAADAGQTGEIQRIRAYPTIFQPWLRNFVIQTPGAVFVGLHSWQEAGCPAWTIHPRPAPSPALALVEATPQARLLEWFADTDTASFVETTPGGLERVRIEDVRYAWASADARGMWGIEAYVDTDGRLVGDVLRIARNSPSSRDFDRIGDLLMGRLPVAGDGWSRPSNCRAGS